MKNSSDDDLIEQIKIGDEKAAEELIKRYYTSILRYCKSHCFNSEKAEDLTQETFLKLFRNLSEYKGKRKFKAYLYTIECNEMRRIEDRSEINYLLNALSPDQREAVILRFGEELSFWEIAKVTGCNMRTAQSRARNALKIMSGKMNREMGDRELKKYLQQSMQQGTELKKELDRKGIRLEETIKLCTEMMRDQKLAQKSQEVRTSFVQYLSDIFRFEGILIFGLQAVTLFIICLIFSTAADISECIPVVMPLFVLAVIPVMFRCQYYGMSEIEAVTRASGAQILLAKLVLAGVQILYA